MSNTLQGSDRNKFPGTFGSAAQTPVTLSAEMAALLGKAALAPLEKPITNVEIVNNSYVTVSPVVADNSGAIATTSFTKGRIPINLISSATSIVIGKKECFIDSTGMANIFFEVQLAPAVPPNWTEYISGFPAPAQDLGWIFNVQEFSGAANARAYMQGAAMKGNIPAAAGGYYYVTARYSVA